MAAKLLPAGAVRDSARQPSSLQIASFIHRILRMPVERFAREQGVKLPEEGKNGPPVVRVRLLQILDPASQTRISVIDPIVRQMVGDAAATKEQQFREALALAYGQRLSVSELRALDHFLATPEGAAFVRVSTTLENDLDVFAAKQSIDRAIADAMPAIMNRISAATAALPRIKTTADLNEAQRKQVAELLHIDPAQLRK